MNKKQIIFTIVLLCLTNVSTWFLSSHEIEWDDNHIPCDCYSTHDALVAERQYCGAIFEILHDYWEFLDVQYTDSTVVRHAFWKDVIMEGDAYHTADSINGGDWEDFFYHWYTEDDCHHE